MLKNNTTILENNTTTTESYTLEHQSEEGGESKIREFENDKFDIVDYAKLVAKKIVEQLENNRKKLDPEIDNNNAKLITDKHHPEVEKSQAYKDKETLKNFLSYYAQPKRRKTPTGRRSIANITSINVYEPMVCIKIV